MHASSTFNKSANLWIVITMAVWAVVGAADAPAQMDDRSWTDSFSMDDCAFSSTGRNQFFILEPGYSLLLAGAEDGNSVRLEIVVMNETEVVDGITTRVVQERESVNGELIEISRNFFAFCKSTGSVFYFGEDVDIYKDGKVVGHEGAWRAGVDGARPGIMMPGQVLIGGSYYQEIAPEVAMDRACIVKTNAQIETPSGKYEKCLVVEETTPLEPKAREFKTYAPGIGLIQDGALLLVSTGFE